MSGSKQELTEQEHETESIVRTTLKMRKNRTEAISATIERNPNAFRPKIAAPKQAVVAPVSIDGTPNRAGAVHSKG